MQVFRDVVYSFKIIAFYGNFHFSGQRNNKFNSVTTRTTLNFLGFHMLSESKRVMLSIRFHDSAVNKFL